MGGGIFGSCFCDWFDLDNLGMLILDGYLVFNCNFVVLVDLVFQFLCIFDVVVYSILVSESFVGLVMFILVGLLVGFNVVFDNMVVVFGEGI